eukprot:CAMPEP_0178737820 /NCGR_PEP_ID=MMETSP0744-20121128/3181_1 /TAXON_ID=913974 /ORGANISM="Nitzschia punctata, Strain CCMP561" /LENGTH=145 /DNA_ID=CAMNT_0020390393 /DNA_START=21 /DNA_END=458 /DNA_ORIENTATION=+
MAQSGGWMGSAKELLHYQSDLCNKKVEQSQHYQNTTGATGSFLPPFDAPLYARDGLWRHNVEFWSGGIQLWGGMCEVQRVVSLSNPDEFSRHLIYHASNNKQHRIGQERLVLAQSLWSELKFVQTKLEQDFYAKREWFQLDPRAF